MRHQEIPDMHYRKGKQVSGQLRLRKRGYSNGTGRVPVYEILDQWYLIRAYSCLAVRSNLPDGVAVKGKKQREPCLVRTWLDVAVHATRADMPPGSHSYPAASMHAAIDVSDRDTAAVVQCRTGVHGE